MQAFGKARASGSRLSLRTRFPSMSLPFPSYCQFHPKVDLLVVTRGVSGDQLYNFLKRSEIHYDWTSLDDLPEFIKGMESADWLSLDHLLQSWHWFL